jgi:hypothetical protein
VEPFDCEVFRAGFPTQPVNTVSSVVFVVAAVVLWRRGHRLAALAAGLAGVGSVLLHGAPSGASSWLHDIGLYAVMAVAAIELWRRVSTGRPPVLAVAAFVVGGVIWFLSRTDGVLCAPESLLQGHSVWHALSSVALVVLFLAPEVSGRRD